MRLRHLVLIVALLALPGCTTLQAGWLAMCGLHAALDAVCPNAPMVEPEAGE